MGIGIGITTGLRTSGTRVEAGPMYEGWLLSKSTDWTAAPDTSAVGAGVTLHDGWIDAAGDIWSVESGNLIGATDDGGGYLSKFLLRPSSESEVDSRIAVDYAPGLLETGRGIPAAMLRWNAGPTNYYCHLGATFIRIYSFVGGGGSQIANENWTLSYDSTHSYQLVFEAAGTSPTTVTATVHDITAGKVAGRAIVTNSASGLQVAGRAGLSLFSAGGTVEVLHEQTRIYRQGSSPFRTTPVKFGFIGDSITYQDAQHIAYRTAGILQRAYPRRDWQTVAVQAVSGTETSAWVSGSGYLTDAIAAFTAAGVTHVPIMLGTNDTKSSVRTSAAGYRANIQSTIDALISAGFIPILNSCHCVVAGSYDGAWDATSNVLAQAYNAELNTLANGTTVLRGDRSAYTYFAAHPEQLGDGVHPMVDGEEAFATLWANGMKAI